MKVFIMGDYRNHSNSKKDNADSLSADVEGPSANEEGDSLSGDVDVDDPSSDIEVDNFTNDDEVAFQEMCKNIARRIQV